MITLTSNPPPGKVSFEKAQEAFLANPCTDTASQLGWWITQLPDTMMPPALRANVLAELSKEYPQAQFNGE